jgi:hypothetical protein
VGDAFRPGSLPGGARGSGVVRYLLSGAAVAVRAYKLPMFHAAVERVCKRVINKARPAAPGGR